MKQISHFQPIDPVDVYAMAKRKGIKLKTIAKRLRRSPGALSHALNVKRPKLLARMKRYLEKLPDKRAAA
jgi:lambda repressor-like predicted transcriptional regulator